MSKLLEKLEEGRDEGIANRKNPAFTLTLEELQEIIDRIDILERGMRHIVEVTRSVRDPK